MFLLVTYDVNEHFSFTTEAHVAYTNWDYTDKNFKPDSANQRAHKAKFIRAVFSL